MHKPLRGAVAAGFLFALILSGQGCSRQNNEPPAATGPGMLIVPHMTVGPIRAGMSLDQLVAEVGEPRRKSAKAYDYPQLGLAVIPREGEVIAAICGDVTGINGAYVKVFNGRTREGIGMRSTRDEVISAYGPPTETKGRPDGLESMKYETVGITFNLEGGKVHHMIVLLDGQEGAPRPEADDSIQLKIAPADPEPEK